jgi:hypothetical protein
VLQLDRSHRPLDIALGPRALQAIQQGIDAGRVDVPDVYLALTAMCGALLHTMRECVLGKLNDHAASQLAEALLRQLGLTPAEAHEVAGRTR